MALWHPTGSVHVVHNFTEFDSLNIDTMLRKGFPSCEWISFLFHIHFFLFGKDYIVVKELATVFEVFTQKET